MPVDPGLYLMFLVAIVAIGLTPGPDMLFILATSVSPGPVAGLFASLGTAAGMLVLGLTFVAVGLVIDGTIGFLAGRLGSWLQRRRRADVILNRVAGAVFIALAVRLVT